MCCVRFPKLRHLALFAALLRFRCLSDIRGYRRCLRILVAQCLFCGREGTGAICASRWLVGVGALGGNSCSDEMLRLDALLRWGLYPHWLVLWVWFSGELADVLFRDRSNVPRSG